MEKLLEKMADRLESAYFTHGGPTEIDADWHAIARAALEVVAPLVRRKDEALNVWLCSYASDMVSPEDAVAAASALNEHGTLCFIINALESGNL